MKNKIFLPYFTNRDTGSNKMKIIPISFNFLNI